MQTKIILTALAMMTFFSSCVIASNSVPINEQWDVRQKNSSLARDFEITEYRSYLINIDFGTIGPSNGYKDMTEMKKFMGDSGGLYDLETHNYPSLPASEETKEHIREGKTIFKHEKPGAIIPVHLRIEKLDVDGSAILIDKTIETEGSLGADISGEGRRVSQIDLRPGKYRLNITTLQDTVLPRNVESWLVVKANPIAAVLNDNQ